MFGKKSKIHVFYPMDEDPSTSSRGYGVLNLQHI